VADISSDVMLYVVMLCYAMLCYAMLCYASIVAHISSDIHYFVFTVQSRFVDNGFGKYDDPSYTCKHIMALKYLSFTPEIVVVIFWCLVSDQ